MNNFEDAIEQAYWEFDSTKNSGMSERDRFKWAVRNNVDRQPEKKMYQVVRVFASYSGCEGWSTSERLIATITTDKNVNNKQVRDEIVTALGYGSELEYSPIFRISFEFSLINPQIF